MKFVSTKSLFPHLKITRPKNQRESLKLAKDVAKDFSEMEEYLAKRDQSISSSSRFAY